MKLFQPSPSIDNNLNLEQLTPTSIANPISISPIPMLRRNSSNSTELNVESLPAPVEFADCRQEIVMDDQNAVYVNFCYNLKIFIDFIKYVLRY
jgi:hypothetical protein